MSHDHRDHDRDHDEIHDHDLGLGHDLDKLAEQRRTWGRRGLLGVLGGLGAVAVVGCASDADTPSAAGASSPSSVPSSPASSSSSSSSSPSVPSASATPQGAPSADTPAFEVADAEIPEETAGPFPGNGTNGPDVLSESGVVRRDLTRSVGAASGVADGVPVTVRLRVYDLAGDEATVLPGAAIYLWHATADGKYSMYDDGVADENFLRGVQEADADGIVEFTTVFPGCYPGRWPHMHFEVYPSIRQATAVQGRLRTSQLAVPAATCREVYGSAGGYQASVAPFDDISLDTDLVFSDGYSLQMARATGSVADGYTLSLGVPV